MKELIERIEGAEGESAALFWDAYRTAFPSLRSRDHSVEECEKSDLRAYRFGRMLDAEAWLSAAEMLVPDGSEWELTTLYGVARAAVDLNSDEGPSYGSNECGSPALALAAAALKARGE